ncbi:MAG: cysteine-rich small domain-containing protein [Planctomycetaceae bacterium]|jgi:Zn-finger protein|nr:cysteine-rich small domain-containing protein [Planctomycetaceae bacterium]
MNHSYKFFRNTDCIYFPCHQDIDVETFNCLFCYCPLYFLGDQCGGHFECTGKTKKTKCCTKCSIPHELKNYDTIIDRLKELINRDS